MSNLSFSEALENLKEGRQICRKDWKEKNIFIFLVKKHDFPLIKDNVVDFTRDRTLPFIVMNTINDRLTPWIANQSDLLLEDWMILE